MTKTNHRRTTTAVIVAMLAALLLAGAPREAAATFPGENGKIAFASNRTIGEGVDNPEGDFEIFTMNPDGTDLKQLTKNDAFDFNPEWSPDGEKIAFESDRALFSEIFVMNADGTDQIQVTTNSDFSFDRSPTFSPDGGKIAFESNRATGVDNPEKDIEIFVVDLDGMGLTQLTRNAGRELHPDWSPNGRKIAFVSERDFNHGIYTMNADGTQQRKRSRGPAIVFQFPSWSPDGSKIAFSSDQDGPTEIHTMNPNGSQQTRLTLNGAPSDSGPVFSPGGKKIAFHGNQDGNFEIYKMRTDGKKQINLTNDPAGDFTPDWQPLEKEH